MKMMVVMIVIVMVVGVAAVVVVMVEMVVNIIVMMVMMRVVDGRSCMAFLTLAALMKGKVSQVVQSFAAFRLFVCLKNLRERVRAWGEGGESKNNKTKKYASISP